MASPNNLHDLAGEGHAHNGHGHAVVNGPQGYPPRMEVPGMAQVTFDQPGSLDYATAHGSMSNHPHHAALQLDPRHFQAISRDQGHPGSAPVWNGPGPHVSMPVYQHSLQQQQQILQPLLHTSQAQHAAVSQHHSYNATFNPRAHGGMPMPIGNHPSGANTANMQNYRTVSPTVHPTAVRRGHGYNAREQGMGPSANFTRHNSMDMHSPDAMALTLSPISNLEDLLKGNTVGDGADFKFRGYIENYQQARVIKKKYLTMFDGAYDEKLASDFPTDPEELKGLVERLFWAISNMDGIVDNLRKPQPNKGKGKTKGKKGQAKTRSKKRARDEEQDDQDDDSNSDASGRKPHSQDAKGEDNAHMKHIKALTAVEVELLAWDILYAARDVQCRKYAKARWEDDYKTKGGDSDCFMDRFEAIIESLTKSKAMCQGLLQAPWIKRIVSQPKEELKRKGTNQVINEKRNQQVAAANALKNKGYLEVNDENLQYTTASGEVIAPGKPQFKNMVERAKTDSRGKKRSKVGHAGSHHSPATPSPLHNGIISPDPAAVSPGDASFYSSSPETLASSPSDNQSVRSAVSQMRGFDISGHGSADLIDFNGHGGYPADHPSDALLDSFLLRSTNAPAPNNFQDDDPFIR